MNNIHESTKIFSQNFCHLFTTRFLCSIVVSIPACHLPLDCRPRGTRVQFPAKEEGFNFFFQSSKLLKMLFYYFFSSSSIFYEKEQFYLHRIMPIFVNLEVVFHLKKSKLVEFLIF